jgi:transcriptional regulator GlxA family with amidase domain
MHGVKVAYNVELILARIRRLVSADPGTSLSQLSAGLGTERRTVERIIRQETGLSFREYRWKVRMDIGAGLLSSSNRGVKEIATLCGYQWSQNFCRAFERRYGTSPAQFRRINPGPESED